MTKNYFVTLGLKPGASEDEIKKAYRSLAKKWHPDKNHEKGAEDKFKEIAAAYEYLKNKDRREILERDLTKKPTAKSAPGPTPSYHQHYETRTSFEEPSYSGAYSSYYRNSENNKYSSSTFGAEPKTSRSTDDVKNDKRKRKPQRKPPTWKPWDNDWNTSMDDEDMFFDRSARTATPRTNFSFAFRSFMDDLGVNFDAFFRGAPFEFSSFFDDKDPFADFFSQGTFSSINTGRTQQGPSFHRKRHVAPERGADGLSEDYFFTPRQGRSEASFPTYTEKDTAFTEDDATVYSSSDYDDEFNSTLFKCTYCGRHYPFKQLSTHEPGCAVRNGGKFDNSDTESVASNYDNEDQYPSQPTGDWRQTHEELLRNIRRAKHAYYRNKPRESEPSSNNDRSQPNESLSQVKCKWCGRNFSHPAAKQHIPFCEKWTKEHGTPLNPKGKAATRDQGSKAHRAREYAKHIPKPRSDSHDEFDDNSPRSPRHNVHFPDIGGHKRETMTKPTAASSTGLHTNYSPKSGKKPSTKTRKFPTSTSDNAAFKPNEGSYGFGIRGSRMKGESKSSQIGDGCPICKKRYGSNSRFNCSCGVKRGT